MSAVLGQLEPLPGGVYGSTMAVADVYPTTAPGVIGGIRTQDRALPAYGEARQRAIDNPGGIGGARGLLGTPTGYVVLLIVALVVLSHYYK